MKYFVTISLLFVAGICFSQRIEADYRASDNRVDITIGGKLFTSYYFPGPDLVKKPVLYPVYSPGGKLVTRGWPLDPRSGERVDHPHHIGVWFNYEDVNGNDFWNHSIQVSRPGKKYGTVLNTRIAEVKSHPKKAELTATSDWVAADGRLLLVDTTRISFHTKGKSVYLVDYEVILHAPEEEVSLKDVKDGMFAIRLARELELPYKEPQLLTGADGKVREEKIVENERVSGAYYNKEGVEGDDVWGKSSAWCAIKGAISGERITVALFDHPGNFGYPGFWHARGYGLFALNSVARNAYVKGSTPLDFRLQKGESARFRYRVVVASSHLSKKQLDDLERRFGVTK